VNKKVFCLIDKKLVSGNSKMMDILILSNKIKVRKNKNLELLMMNCLIFYGIEESYN
jgi:hypothetical protein